jgi:hypothetical protein
VSELPEFEPYAVLRRLESDPTSELYLAQHETLERQVWIKALRPHVPLSSPFATRILREGQILARLSHPGILDILDCVTRPPRLWLVLEAVDGWPLSEVLESLRRGNIRLDIRGAVALVLQLTRGLGHAHEAGIVHGALRPRHILITKHGLAKLAGFSSARRLEELPDSVQVESEPGSFEAAYLSPEQVLGESLDERSDLFSLGVVLYELLAGQRPFGGAAESATTQNIRHAAPEPLGQSNREVSPELERIVQRCLEKQRERRFDSTAQLGRALEHVLGSRALAELEPMVARALGQAGLAVASNVPGPRTRADEIRRREAGRGLERSLIALAFVSGTLLLGGAALYAWLDSTRSPPVANPGALAVAERAQLLVVADPWAYVFLDGARVETTPFATPLDVAPGVHHVRLEHPGAPAERRKLEFAPGQRIVLQVAMKVTRAVVEDAGVNRGGGNRDAGSP